MAITQKDIGKLIHSPGGPGDPPPLSPDYVLPQEDGLDVVRSQAYLREQLANVEQEIKAIQANSNLSDTERMFAMQMAMNSWSAISNLRTNMIKSVSDILKAIVRNIQ